MVTVVICTPSARQAPLVKEASHPPSARNGCTSWQSPHFGQRGWFVWDRRSASWVGIFGFVVLLFDTAC